ncbi:phage holin family protein [Faecalibaculum rodentium]|uniref:phage holin family protein n=1 Tax=Faecalibaculum rodentium TaxID=1702221 RepID=UPI0025991958|nr:phage holin family protein [Faecalibaculum rodentium]
MEIFGQALVPTTLIICLCVGYCVKNFVPEEAVNKYIPAIMCALGAVITCLAQGFTWDGLGAGMLTGLASTGLHQLLTRTLEGLSDGHAD